MRGNIEQHVNASAVFEQPREVNAESHTHRKEKTTYSYLYIHVYITTSNYLLAFLFPCFNPMRLNHSLQDNVIVAFLCFLHVLLLSFLAFHPTHRKSILHPPPHSHNNPNSPFPSPLPPPPPPPTSVAAHKSDTSAYGGH